MRCVAGRRHEELAVHQHPVGRAERHLLRRDEAGAGVVGWNRLRREVRAALPLPDCATTAGRIGVFASARRKAIALPSLVNTGRSAIVGPVVTAVGAPPVTATCQMCR